MGGGGGGRRNMKGHSVGNIKRCEAGEIGGGIEIIKGFTQAVKEKGVSLGAYQGFWRMPQIQGMVGGRPRSKMSKFISYTVFYLYLFFKVASLTDRNRHENHTENTTSLLVVLFLIPQVTILCKLIFINFFSLSAFVSCSFCSF